MARALRPAYLIAARAIDVLPSRAMLSPPIEESAMKTGNGASPNPKGIFKGGFGRDSSNVVKQSAGTPMSAKRDPFPKGKKSGKAK